MTKSKAIARAIKLAQRSGYDYLIITAPDWRNNFNPVREDHFNNSWMGSIIHACVEPSGHVHY